MNKYNNPRLTNTTIAGSGMKHPVRPHVIIGDPKNGYIQGDLMDANAVKESVSESVNKLVDGAPEALDTLKEIADKAELIDSLATKELVNTLYNKQAPQINVGDILYADGTISPDYIDGKKPVGICVIAPEHFGLNSKARFASVLFPSSSFPYVSTSSRNPAWYSYGDLNIETLPQVEPENTIYDINGANNTLMCSAYIESGGYSSLVLDMLTYIHMADGFKNFDWYIPSIGELIVLHNNIHAVDSKLYSLITSGHHLEFASLSDKEYWSSTKAVPNPTNGYPVMYYMGMSDSSTFGWDYLRYGHAVLLFVEIDPNDYPVTNGEVVNYVKNAIADAVVQSDFTETDTESPAYIKNNPIKTDDTNGIITIYPKSNNQKYFTSLGMTSLCTSNGTRRILMDLGESDLSTGISFNCKSGSTRYMFGGVSIYGKTGDDILLADGTTTSLSAILDRITALENNQQSA